MPYVDTQWRIQVRGTIGSETWNNTWTVEDQTTGQDVQEAADILNDFYSELVTLGHGSGYSDTGARAKNLATDETVDLVWTTHTGAGGTLLPTEVAARLSLRDDAGHRGGPFLAGFNETALFPTGGTMDPSIAQGIIDEVGLKAADLIAAGWRLGIDSPTDTAVYLATVARMGVVFDVIRRRRNDIPEEYRTTSVAP